MRLRVSAREEDPGVTIYLVGEVDLESVPTVTDAVRSVLAGRPGRRVTVDLAGVTFLDASGIGALVQGGRLARAAGWDYRLVGAQGMPLWVLTMTGILPAVEAGAAPNG